MFVLPSQPLCVAALGLFGSATVLIRMRASGSLYIFVRLVLKESSSYANYPVVLNAPLRPRVLGLRMERLAPSLFSISGAVKEEMTVN